MPAIAGEIVIVLLAAAERASRSAGCSAGAGATARSPRPATT